MILNDIYEGWKNHLLPSEFMKDTITNVSKERLAVCAACPFHSKFHNSIRPDDHCTDCGCSLLPKTKCLSCSCPQNKWIAVLTPEEEQTVKKNETNI